MKFLDARGTVVRTYANRDGEIVALIRWTRGTGPSTVPGDGLRDGQSVRIMAGSGKVVPA
ncbi:MAG: hypothetical protein ACK4E3_03530 [Brevundimonas sp.]|uniref:hypothetical protein n=1 Tax=Brevundimonas sp. TaxID=1871086 RepID=UPI00391D5C41